MCEARNPELWLPSVQGLGGSGLHGDGTLLSRMLFSAIQLGILALVHGAGPGSLTHPLWLPIAHHGTG